MDSHLNVCLQNGDSVSLNVHSVMKRFLTPNGIVLLLESSSDWRANLENSVPWVHSTEERGCFVIRNYAIDGAGGISDISPSISQLRSEVTLKPGDPSKATSFYLVAEARTINDVVIPSYRDIIESRHQFVENALFDCIRDNGTVQAR